DGSTSSTTLTVTTTTTTTLANDSAMVRESGLANGTSPSVADTVASGNLFDHDVGLGAGAAINRVSIGGTNYTADGNGVITVTDAHGTLQVYTQAYAGRAAGDYTYTLTGRTAEGSTDVRTYSYRVGDGTSNYTANLTINVQDDAPSAV